MNRGMLDIGRGLIFLLMCIVSFSPEVVAQEVNDSKAPRGLVLRARTGVAFFVTEVHRDFSGSASEFNYQPGLSAGMEVSRFIAPALEAGIGFSYTKLQGHAETPDFSAAGIDPYMRNLLSEPMEFTNRLFGPTLFAQYHLDLKVRAMSLFFKTGTGLLYNESELFYRNRKNDEIIFGKGSGEHKYNKLVNGVYFLASGLNYGLSELVTLNLSAGLNVVGYDFLDVVHNYDAAGNRREVLGLYTDLTAGIAIRLPGNGFKRKKTNSGSRLPFAP